MPKSYLTTRWHILQEVSMKSCYRKCNCEHYDQNSFYGQQHHSLAGYDLASHHFPTLDRPSQLLVQ